MRTAALVTVIGIGLGATACGSGGASAPASARPSVPASTPSRATTSPAEAAAQNATTAYLAMWDDVAAVAATSDWQSSRLADHTTGDALSVLSRQMYADHANRLITKGHPVGVPVVQSVDSQSAPKTVMIRDCSDASGWLKYRTDTGKPADSEPGGKHLINAEVKLGIDGSWRVTRFAVAGTGSC